ncbi:MAG: hypothetical protein ACE5Z5_03445 [Candidatus Bathyarchaeia archaeon]
MKPIETESQAHQFIRGKLTEAYIRGGGKVLGTLLLCGIGEPYMGRDKRKNMESKKKKRRKIGRSRNR